MRENAHVEKMEMPTDLTNTERKFIHQLAGQLGLHSKSHGKGDNRKITISKQKKPSQTAGGDGNDGDNNTNDDKLPLLSIGAKGRAALQKHVRLHPPTPLETAESKWTGSYLSDRIRHQHGTGQTINALDENEVPDAKPIHQGEEEEELLHALDELHLGSDSQHLAPHSNSSYQVSQGALDARAKRRMAAHFASQKAKRHDPSFKQMLKHRQQLPAFSYAESICKSVQSHAVTILTGDTGCGKSTQVPQFLLDDPTIGPTCNIVITQPRRISAISVAERVASEQCSSSSKTVGYQVRLESSFSPDETQLLFVTPGILLRKLQSSPSLSEYSHIILDEVHERDRYTEFLMICLKNLLASGQRPDLHVILMSATLQTNALMEYWSGLNDTSGFSLPAQVSIPGRTFPVQEYFLEDALAMTGFVNDDRFESDMTLVESELEKVLGRQIMQQQQSQSHGKQRHNNRQKSKDPHTLAMGGGNTLTCVMCNHSGFKSPEELGTHVALCDGGGGIGMDQLEEKVREIPLHNAFFSGYDDGAAAAANQDEEEEDYEIEDLPPQNEDDDDDDDDPGTVMGKWDGESPFMVADMMSSKNTGPTLTEEEQLNRYQSMHDDEQVDYELLLAVIQYIHGSSYGDGAILIFFPGWNEISEFTMLLEVRVGYFVYYSVGYHLSYCYPGREGSLFTFCE
jgi:transcription elongation factor Elf1